MNKNHQFGAPDRGAMVSNNSDVDRVDKVYFPFSNPHPGPKAGHGHEEIIDTHVRPETFL